MRKQQISKSIKYTPNKAVYKTQKETKGAKSTPVDRPVTSSAPPYDPRCQTNVAQGRGSSPPQWPQAKRLSVNQVTSNSLPFQVFCLVFPTDSICFLRLFSFGDSLGLGKAQFVKKMETTKNLISLEALESSRPWHYLLYMDFTHQPANLHQHPPDTPCTCMSILTAAATCVPVAHLRQLMQRKTHKAGAQGVRLQLGDHPRDPKAPPEKKMLTFQNQPQNHPKPPS